MAALLLKENQLSLSFLYSSTSSFNQFLLISILISLIPAILKDSFHLAWSYKFFLLLADLILWHPQLFPPLCSMVNRRSSFEFFKYVKLSVSLLSICTSYFFKHSHLCIFLSLLMDNFYSFFRLLPRYYFLLKLFQSRIRFFINVAFVYVHVFCVHQHTHSLATMFSGLDCDMRGSYSFFLPSLSTQVSGLHHYSLHCSYIIALESVHQLIVVILIQ